MNDSDERYQDGLTREEILIGRVTDGEASSTDWRELESMAETDPAVLQRLAEAQRVHAELERAVEDRIAIAELVEARALRAATSSWSRFGRTMQRVGMIGGWAVAATLGVMWYAGPGPSNGSNVNGPVTSGSNPAVVRNGSSGRAGVVQPVNFEQYDPDVVFDGYLRSGVKSGQILGVMPMEMIEVQPTASGRQQVIVVRRIVERREVDALEKFEWQSDENGIPRLQPRRTGSGAGPM
ncbi:hypothetical protein [Pyruvatibacter sp.]|uniref:hypothetical protein n=1 Tax=Pyruvatibacter sp. TaxID=1981328 RepID=UPI0032EDAF0B